MKRNNWFLVGLNNIYVVKSNFFMVFAEEVDQRFLSWYFDFSLKPNKICSSKTIAFYIFAYYTSFPVLVQSNDWWTIQTFGFVPKHSIDFEKENLFFVKVWSLLIVSFKVIEVVVTKKLDLIKTIQIDGNHEKHLHEQVSLFMWKCNLFAYFILWFLKVEQ